VLKENKDAIVVDAGDSLLTLQRLGDREQGRLLAQAYNEMHYDAIALGGMDFRMGLDVLREQIDVADYAVLSANTQDPKTGQAFDQRYVLIEQDGHRIALVGLTDAKITTEVTQGAVPIDDPIEALMEVVDEVVYQADVIIVLSHLGMVYDMNLPTVVPEVDLIVSGFDKEVYDPPLTAAGPLIVSAGSRGEHIGRVDMHFDAEGNLVSFDSDMQILTEEVVEDTEMRQWLLQSGLTPATALKSGDSGTLSQ
jgi:2',3'-cyclic-nucleotide 2'-phosphodiesterase (5'-nucleotidase family)